MTSTPPDQPRPASAGAHCLARALSLAVSTACAGPALAGGAVTFAKGDFAPGSFHAQVVQGGIGGTSTLVTVPAGGNPDSYLSIEHVLAAGAPSGGYCANWVWSFVFIDAATVLPASMGGIGAIDFAIESLPIASGNASMVQSQTLCVRQGGRLYIGAPGVTPGGGWSPVVQTGIQHSDFAEVINAAPCAFLDPSSRPDFTSAVAPIEFGFARGNSTDFGGNGSTSFIIMGADNWSVTLHPCGPECCAADLNSDGAVDGADLGMLLGNWGGAGTGDLDGSGLVDGADLGRLLGAWGPCP